MARPYFQTSLADLREMARTNVHNQQVLGEIRAELSFRRSDAARQLERELLAIADGRLSPPPRPPRPDRPDDQGELL
jgi:hypothetical protein